MSVDHFASIWTRKLPFSYERTAMWSIKIISSFDAGWRLNDLYKFYPNATAWINLTLNSSGATPTPRAYFGFASTGNDVYVFGGNDPAQGVSQQPVSGCCLESIACNQAPFILKTPFAIFNDFFFRKVFRRSLPPGPDEISMEQPHRSRLGQRPYPAVPARLRIWRRISLHAGGSEFIRQ